MNQPIAGVAPIDGPEVTVMMVSPSVAASRLLGFPVGRLMGQLMGIQAGFYIFRVGNLFTALFTPLGLLLYLLNIAPFFGNRYRMTNKRIAVERCITGDEIKSINLDRFDSIQVEVQTGDAWYDAGDLVFKQGDIERFRLEGVSRPEAFRHVCLKAHKGYVGVQRALAAMA